MTPPSRSSCPFKHASSGFTLVQWLTVVGVLAVLTAILVPVISKMRESARRAACAENLRQIGIAAERYAAQNRDRLPSMEAAPGWAWDVPVEVTSDLIRTGAVDRDSFYCPSGPYKDRARLWQHSVTRTRGEESGTRVISYVLLFEGARSVLPRYTNGELGAGGNGDRESAVVPSERELAVDAVISAGAGREANFHSITMGDSPRPDRTNHLDGRRPAGGNILFLDGHVAWREFEEMDETKVTTAPLFWW